MQSSDQSEKKAHGGRLKARMHNIDALQRAIEVCGGKRSVLAKRLGVSWQTVALWLETGKDKKGKKKGACITAERALCIEYVTGGKVTRQDLRPDLWAPMEEYYDEVAEG